MHVEVAEWLPRVPRRRIIEPFDPELVLSIYLTRRHNLLHVVGDARNRSWRRNLRIFAVVVQPIYNGPQPYNGVDLRSYTWLKKKKKKQKKTYKILIIFSSHKNRHEILTISMQQSKKLLGFFTQSWTHFLQNWNENILNLNSMFKTRLVSEFSALRLFIYYVWVARKFSSSLALSENDREGKTNG